MGKALTATDPAFVGMAEITITLKPEEQWRPGMTWDRLLDEMDAKLRIPGFPNIWWMPIQTRTEMITTGVRSPVGIKVLGPDLKTIEKIGLRSNKSWPLCLVPRAPLRNGSTKAIT